MNNGWLSVKEKLPEHGQKVLVYWPEAPMTQTFEECMFCARYERSDRRTKGWFDTSEFDDDYYPYSLRPGKEIQYWYPFPAPPK